MRMHHIYLRSDSIQIKPCWIHGFYLLVWWDQVALKLRWWKWMLENTNKILWYTIQEYIVENRNHRFDKLLQKKYLTEINWFSLPMTLQTDWSFERSCLSPGGTLLTFEPECGNFLVVEIQHDCHPKQAAGWYSKETFTHPFLKN
jgi:hypothetical protein